MKEHPIIFSGEMVRAILDGRKTQTRRVCKPQPSDCKLPGGRVEVHQHTGGRALPLAYYVHDGFKQHRSCPLRCPYGKPGDTLWVKEAWRPARGLAATASKEMLKGPGGAALQPGIDYRASVPAKVAATVKWRPSIFLPRVLARITLEVTDVRVERVQDISVEDAYAEGAPCWECDGLCAFRKLWDSINDKRGFGWVTNPWVWVVSFKVVRGEK